MNKNIVSGKWDEFKGEVRKMWGELTNDDLERTKGNVGAISGLLQQKYGNMKDDARAHWDNLVQRYSGEMADASERVKEDVRETNDADRIRH